MRHLAPLAPMLALAAFAPAAAAQVPAEDGRLAQVRAVHGGAGPWAVVGYRMGERALGDLDLPRHSFALKAVHRCPAEVQYSCIADGLQAATGASPGKMNLAVEAAPLGAMQTVVRDAKSGKSLTFTVKPELARSIQDLPRERLEAEGRRVLALPDEALFDVVRGD